MLPIFTPTNSGHVVLLFGERHPVCGQRTINSNLGHNPIFFSLRQYCSQTRLNLTTLDDGVFVTPCVKSPLKCTIIPGRGFTKPTGQLASHRYSSPPCGTVSRYSTLTKLGVVRPSRETSMCSLVPLPGGMTSTFK